MNLHIFDTAHELALASAEYFIRQANHYIKERGQFNVVLAGGSSPKRAYELLASPDFRDQVDWTKVYFFFGDERYVPADDPDSNALMAEQAFLTPLQISAAQVYKVNTTLPPAEAARQYMETIKSHFREKPIHFDLILLGLGDDAHTASLFPGTDVLNEQSPTIIAVYLKAKDTYRITMTAPLINQAKHIAFLVYGESKARAVHQVIKGEHKPEEFPAQLINDQNQAVNWFLDTKAAGLLKPD